MKKTYEMRRIFASLKAPVSRKAKQYLKDTNDHVWLSKLTTTHGSRKTFRFWQPGGGFDENIDNRKAMDDITDYIHANPVRCCLTARPTGWKWSSARAYENIDNVVLKIDKVDF